MEVSDGYRQANLTIGGLVDQLDTQEYRLRRVINTSLGFRNFNEFLNAYRIAEAQRRLTDPACARLPILTIAMDWWFCVDRPVQPRVQRDHRHDTKRVSPPKSERTADKILKKI